jgi:hypothetical protein
MKYIFRITLLNITPLPWASTSVIITTTTTTTTTITKQSINILTISPYIPQIPHEENQKKLAR